MAAAYIVYVQHYFVGICCCTVGIGQRLRRQRIGVGDRLSVYRPFVVVEGVVVVACSEERQRRTALNGKVPRRSPTFRDGS